MNHLQLLLSQTNWEQVIPNFFYRETNWERVIPNFFYRKTSWERVIPNFFYRKTSWERANESFISDKVAPEWNKINAAHVNKCDRSNEPYFP